MTCGLEKGKLALYQPGSTTSSVPIHGAAIFLQPYHVPQVYSASSPSWLLRRLSLWYAPLTICLPTFSLAHWHPSNVFITHSPTPGGRQNKWNKTKQTPKSMSIINSHNVIHFLLCYVILLFILGLFTTHSFSSWTPNTLVLSLPIYTYCLWSW